MLTACCFAGCPFPLYAATRDSSSLYVNVDGKFRWTSHGGSDALSHNNAFRFDSDYDELVVQSSGTYFVYLQLTYNGRATPNVVYVS